MAFYPKDMSAVTGTVAPFGALLGVAPPGVPAYSCDYDTAVDEEHGSYRASWNGIYTGYKYQCVEYARRWLVMAWGVTFLDVRMAYNIFDLPYFVRLRDQAKLPIVKVRNGTAGDRPRRGSVLLWQEGGFFKHTGHVAIVVDASDTSVRIAEQNVTDSVWTDREFARELPVVLGDKGEYKIIERYRNSNVLGWVNLPTALQAELEAERSPAQLQREAAERRAQQTAADEDSDE